MTNASNLYRQQMREIMREFQKTLQSTKKAKSYLNVTVVPVLVFMTLVTNIFTIAVFFRYRRRWNKSHMYYFVMSITETLAISLKGYATISSYLGYFAPDWYDSQGNPNKSLAVCILTSTGHFFNGIAFSCLVLLSIDRVWAIFFPFHYRSSKSSFAKISIGVTILINAVITIPLYPFLKAGLHYPLLTRKYTCWTDAESKYWAFVLGNWNNFVTQVYTYGTPHFVLIISLNAVIIFKLIALRSARDRAFGERQSQMPSDAMTKEISRTRLRMAMFFMYIIFDLPIAIAFAWGYYKLHSDERDSLGRLKTLLIMTKYFGYLMIITYIPPAVNGIFYILEAPFFRKLIWRWFNPSKSVESSKSDIQMNTVTRY